MSVDRRGSVEGGTVGKEQGVGNWLERKQRERCSSIGSSSSIEEYVKRKREGTDEEKKEEGGSPFHRSKKTPRSPTRAGEIGEVEEGKDGREGEGSMKGIEDLKKMMENMWQDQKRGNEGVKGGLKVLEERMEMMRREQMERDKRWQEERIELMGRIEELEKRVGAMEGGERDKNREVGGGMEERMRRIEKEWEMRERKERRRNVIIRGLEIKEGKKREAVKSLLNEIGVEAKLEEMSRVGGGEGSDILLVKLENEEQKREIINKKKILRGRKERIGEDLTWRERRMKWRLEEIARMERERGRRTWVGYGKINIDGEWWSWDEGEEVLRSKEGRVREEGQRGEGK